MTLMLAASSPALAVTSRQFLTHWLSVRDLAITPEGFVYVAAEAGILRFNPVTERFDVELMQPEDGFGGPLPVTAMAADPFGQVWLLRGPELGVLGTDLRVSWKGEAPDWPSALAYVRNFGRGPENEAFEVAHIWLATSQGSWLWVEDTPFTFWDGPHWDASSVADITLGPDRRLWVTDVGSIVRIDPRDESVTRFSAGITPRTHAQTIITGADGNLWFAVAGQALQGDPIDEIIGRITPEGAVTEFKQPAGRAPYRLAPGPDGNVWFTGRNVRGRIGRITPSGDVTEFAPGFSGIPQDIALGRDGNLWVTQQDPSGVVRIRIERPDAVTGAAGGVTSTSATVTGSANVYGDPASTYRFEYGPTAQYGGLTPEQGAGDGTAAVPVSYELSGLAPAREYHYRLVVTNPSGTAYGADRTFTTAPPPPIDADGDGAFAGAGAGADCNDRHPGINPAAHDIPLNGIDENCDGRDALPPPQDADGDGAFAGTGLAADCDDHNRAIHPGADDKPQNGVDEDCLAGDARFREIPSRVQILYEARPGRYRVARLVVGRVLARTRIEIRCSGRGCPFKRRTWTIKRPARKVALQKAFRRSVLRRGAVLEVRVIRGEMLGRVRRDEIRGSVVTQQLCLDPRRVGQRPNTIDTRIKPRAPRLGEDCT